ncbi:hypothetical protein IAT40_005832 [Kwoniella sp. CBS 6097]
MDHRLYLCFSSFVLMLNVGSSYGLSALQAELPRALSVSRYTALAPFGATSLGLAIGTRVGGPIYRRYHARRTATLGSLIWSAAVIAAASLLPRGHIKIALAAFAFGGLGVGICYLAIVTVIGANFSHQPIIGAVIGPLGFATGTALSLLEAVFAGFASSDSHTIARTLIRRSVVSLVATLIVCWGLPAQTHASHSAESSPSMKPSYPFSKASRTLSTILLGNAFPGMTLLGVLVPWIHDACDTRDSQHTETLLAGMTLFLFLGGLFAPTISRLLGPRLGFITLLVVRAGSLLHYYHTPRSASALTALATVLLGHGAGFGMLPPLVKRTDSVANFPSNYAQTLTSWGIAGFLGFLVNAFGFYMTRTYGPSILAASLVTAATALFVIFSPTEVFA